MTTALTELRHENMCIFFLHFPLLYVTTLQLNPLSCVAHFIFLIRPSKFAKKFCVSQIALKIHGRWFRIRNEWLTAVLKIPGTGLVPA